MVEGIVKGIDGVKSVQNELQVVQLFNRKVVKDRLPAITLLDQTHDAQTVQLKHSRSETLDAKDGVV